MKKRSKLFIVPAFIIYTVLMIIPIIGAFGLSFTDWNGISADYDFVGIQNYLSCCRMHVWGMRWRSR